MSGAEPLALYLHLPWCLSKCPYCDFNSHVLRADVSLDRYVAALSRDLADEAPRARGRPVLSVFFGGGTPSVFAPAQIGRIVDALGRYFGLADDAEITMEANPGSLERHALADYRAAGVNRLSLGAQSFDSAALERLGRIHGPEDIDAAFADARRGGFTNVNLDLMFGLPGQSPAAAAADVERAIALGPEHVSYYELTLEPNTVFFAAPPEDLPGEAALCEIQETGLERLAAAGYLRYEVSAFAREGVRCRHNLAYWRFGDYLGVGAGAHGKWVDEDGITWRSQRVAHPQAYMQAVEDGGDACKLRRLEESDLIFDFALNALRLLDGFGAEDFERRTGLPIERIGGILAAAERDGLMLRSAGPRWRPTTLGMRFLNDLQARFLPPRSAGEPAFTAVR